MCHPVLVFPAICLGQGTRLGDGPRVTVVAFTFMGIESIADIIEMPFGRCFHAIACLSLPRSAGDDSADLPVDTYLHDLKEEILYDRGVFPLVSADEAVRYMFYRSQKVDQG